jgi:predicted acylesterase/phospholipase RssA
MKYLVISPGAMGFFMYLGVLSHLKKDGHLHDLVEISGASAGAILGLLYCFTKGDVTRILDYALDVPVKQIMKPNIKSLLTNYGLIPSSKIRKVFGDACTRFTGHPDMTFRDLYEYFPIKLHVSAYNVQFMKTDYFSVDATPSMSVLDAVCSSIAIPFLIASTNGYIDGGSAEVVPGAPFLGREDVLTILLEWGGPMEIKDLKTYTMSILSSTMKLRAMYDFPTLAIPPGDENVYDFSASNEAKLKMFLKGYEQVRRGL